MVYKYNNAAIQWFFIKLQNYNWYCGIGSLEVASDQNNNIVTAIIGYKTSQNKATIESQIGFNHPAWDVKTDLFGESYRAWQRSFKHL